MSFYVKTKSTTQHQALVAAFGWESYPSGEGNYKGSASFYALAEDCGVLIRKHGLGLYGKPGQLKKYWPNRFWRELRKLSKARGAVWPSSAPV